MGDAFTDAAKDAGRNEERRITQEQRNYDTLIAFLQKPCDATLGAALEAFRAQYRRPDPKADRGFRDELERLVKRDAALWATLLSRLCRSDVGRRYLARLKALSPFAGAVIVDAQPGEHDEHRLHVYGEGKELLEALARPNRNFMLAMPGGGTFVAVRRPRRKRPSKK